MRLVLNRAAHAGAYVAVICITLALPRLCAAVQPTVVIPDTPAGHALTTWLDAFNSGDRDRINAYDEAHLSWLTLDDAMDNHKRTGGYELLSVGKSGTFWITFSAREKGASTAISGALVVKPDTDGAISLLMLNPVGPEPNEIKLTAAQRDQVIEGAAKRFADNYVFPDRGRSVADTLEAQRKRGDYRDITNGEILASRLTDDLRAISHDKHVDVRFSKDVVPPDPTANSDPPDRSSGHRPRTQGAARSPQLWLRESRAPGAERRLPQIKRICRSRHLRRDRHRSNELSGRQRHPHHRFAR